MRILLFLLMPALLGAQKQAIVTPSGYLFFNHTNLRGTKAQSGDLAIVQVYTYVDDSLITSTVRNYGGPREININDAGSVPKPAPPLYEALFFMTKGDSASIIQNVDSTLAKRLPSGLRNRKKVRFNIVLVNLITAEEVKKKKDELQAQARIVSINMQNFLKEFNADSAKDIITTPSGLKVQIVEKGAGAAIKDGDNVSSHYFGCLMNGTMFDNSYDRGGPLKIQVDNMMPGLNEGIKMLTKGSKAYLVIPSALGYGEKGNAHVVPPNSDLVFFIDIQQ